MADDTRPDALTGRFPTKLRRGDTVLWGRSMGELGLIAAGGLCAFPVGDALAQLPGPLPAVAMALTAASGPLLIAVRPHGRRLDQWMGALLHYRAARGAYVWRRRPRPAAAAVADRAGWATRAHDLTWAGVPLTEEEDA